jgi:hypothetical protein
MKVTISSIELGVAIRTQDYPGFKYIITVPYRLTCQVDDVYYMIDVPENFLTDGATCAPDWGEAWIYHDWLYSTHGFKDGQDCSRKLADAIFCSVCRTTGFKWYGRIANLVFKCNPFRLVSKAWEYSGKRGPVYAQDVS